eukprot:TRINITY_DN12292_c0_g1_i1.p1 TRINITY_DN12292_c0_g1~~TRINITY_DN12292_c0_g1_i1.p1  ORF type:complete len:1106 (-),score=193.81 TRINITY_DN12292_c0_g1_i1:20-3337(-)
MQTDLSTTAHVSPLPSTSRMPVNRAACSKLIDYTLWSRRSAAEHQLTGPSIHPYPPFQMSDARAVVLQCLRHVLGDSDSSRRSAEQYLEQQAAVPGFATTLAQFLLAPQLPVEIRQISAVVLRKVVKDHWCTDLSPGDRETLQAQLPGGLADPDHRITNAIGLLLGQLAIQAEWPELIPCLLTTISSASSTPDSPAVYGCVRCLEVVAEKVGTDQLSSMVQSVMPAMMRMVEAPQVFSVRTRRHCLRTMWYLLRLASYWREADNPVYPALSEVVPFLLRHSFQQLTLENEFLATEALPMLALVALHFPAQSLRLLPELLQKLWQALDGFRPHFMRAEVGGEPATWEDGYTSEGDTVNPVTVVAQMMEVLTAVLGSRKAKSTLEPLIEPRLGELVRVLLDYSQLTKELLDEWEENPNEFVALEDATEDGYAVIGSVSACLPVRDLAYVAVCNLCQRYRATAPQAVLAAAIAEAQSSAQRRQQGDTNWWKHREAALRILGCICTQSFSTLGKCGITAQQIVEELLRSDLLDPQVPEFLSSRSLFVIDALLQQKQFKPPADLALRLLDAVVGFLGDRPFAIRITACKTIPRLCRRLPDAAAQPYLPRAVAAICNLIPHTSEDSLYRLLTTLGRLLKRCPECDLGSLPQDLLSFWTRHNTDPFLADNMVQVFSSIASNSKCAAALGDSLPLLVSMFAEHERMPGLAESACDILGVIVRQGPPALARHTTVAHFGDVCRIALITADPSIVWSCCKALRAMVTIAKDAIPGLSVTVPACALPGSNPQDTTQATLDGMALLLQLLRALFARDFGEHNTTLNALGALVSQVIADLGAGLSGETVTQILQAVLDKLAEIRSSSLTQSLLMVFANLIHTHRGAVLHFLSNSRVRRSAASVEAETARSNNSDVPHEERALEFVLRQWLRSQSAFFGRNDLRRSAEALMMLLDEPTVQDVAVVLTPVTSLGKTRQATKAKRQQDKAPPAPPVPVRVAVFIALCKAAVQEHESEEEQREAEAERDEGEEGDEEEAGDEEEEDEDDDELGMHFPGMNGESDDEEDDEDAYAPAGAKDAPPLLPELLRVIKGTLPTVPLITVQNYFTAKQKQTLQALLSK